MILVGVHPGGRNKFAVTTLFYNGRLPAAIVSSRAHSGVDDVLADIVGLVGEWGELNGAAIDAPLTWAGLPSGWRDCDLKAQRLLPAWAPKAWWRPPNVLPGAVAVQGPALAWALAREIKSGILPHHRLFETHPRTSLALCASDLKPNILGYRSVGVALSERRRHVGRLLGHFGDAGVVKSEVEPPTSPDELDSLVCAITALGAVAQDCGLVVHELQGGEIRPVGHRTLAVLKALP
ncbi:MAG: DUF429 domain-containing protein [Deltaproteobacteria bacterium]|nr:DUF429 domain-containing protein [Deltaproteobacteria bacterium]